MVGSKILCERENHTEKKKSDPACGCRGNTLHGAKKGVRHLNEKRTNSAHLDRARPHLGAFSIWVTRRRTQRQRCSGECAGEGRQCRTSRALGKAAFRAAVQLAQRYTGSAFCWNGGGGEIKVKQVRLVSAKAERPNHPSRGGAASGGGVS